MGLNECENSINGLENRCPKDAFMVPKSKYTYPKTELMIRR